jgi:hypothetical protein
MPVAREYDATEEPRHYNFAGACAAAAREIVSMADFTLFARTLAALAVAFLLGTNLPPSSYRPRSTRGNWMRWSPPSSERRQSRARPGPSKRPPEPKARRSAEFAAWRWAYAARTESNCGASQLRIVARTSSSSTRGDALRERTGAITSAALPFVHRQETPP